MNPYVEMLIESGYDKQDCSTPAETKKFPLTIHNTVFHTEEEYNEALHEFLNSL